MPLVDELIKRLVPAWYITTLDLTNEYWYTPFTGQKTLSPPQRGTSCTKECPLAFRLLFPCSKRWWIRCYTHIRNWNGTGNPIFPKSRQCLSKKRGLTVNSQKVCCRHWGSKVSWVLCEMRHTKSHVSKVDVIQSWPHHITKMHVCAFLGRAGCYRRYMPYFSTLLAPLTILTN